jgi:hypothetical protein
MSEFEKKKALRDQLKSILDEIDELNIDLVGAYLDHAIVHLDNNISEDEKKGTISS